MPLDPLRETCVQPAPKSRLAVSEPFAYEDHKHNKDRSKADQKQIRSRSEADQKQIRSRSEADQKQIDPRAVLFSGKRASFTASPPAVYQIAADRRHDLG